MNAEPHTHELTVTKDSDGDLLLKYGDQKRYLYRGHYWFLPIHMRERFNLRRVPKATKKLIAKHDRESVHAGEQEDAIAAMATQVNASIPTTGWGSGDLANG